MADLVLEVIDLSRKADMPRTYGADAAIVELDALPVEVLRERLLTPFARGLIGISRTVR